MTPETIALVQASFERVLPIADAVADLFYDRLFALDPSLRALVPADLREQKRKLLGMLAFAVGALDRPAALLPAVERLGARHVGYGVRPEHYATVGQALLWTLEAGLGGAFTPEVRAAWAAVYDSLATTMQATATSVAADAAD